MCIDNYNDRLSYRKKAFVVIVFFSTSTALKQHHICLFTTKARKSSLHL